MERRRAEHYPSEEHPGPSHLQRMGPFSGASCCQHGQHLPENWVVRSQIKSFPTPLAPSCPGLAQAHTPTHRWPGTTGGSPAAWWHPSSCASVPEPPPHRQAQSRVCLGGKRTVSRVPLQAPGKIPVPTPPGNHHMREHSPSRLPMGIGHTPLTTRAPMNPATDTGYSCPSTQLPFFFFF